MANSPTSSAKSWAFPFVVHPFFWNRPFFGAQKHRLNQSFVADDCFYLIFFTHRFCQTNRRPKKSRCWKSWNFAGWWLNQQNLQNIRQNRNLPQIGVNINVWNHHLVFYDPQDTSSKRCLFRKRMQPVGTAVSLYVGNCQQSNLVSFE